MPEIQIPAHDGGPFKAYIALPDKVPAPVVIMIQEIFGINQEMRDKCDDMAARGYVALCPDLFWRIEPGIELVDSVPEQLQRAFDLFGQFDVEMGIADLKSTLEYMRGFEASNGKTGCVGYCLGGKLAYLMAAESDIDASVAYYGVGIEGMTDMAGNITKPLLMHVAEEDEFVPKDAQEQIKLALMPKPNISIHFYPGVNHAFARGQGMHYNADAAREANERTREFLEKALSK
ncbi:MAG: dienelactone hydrolase family protein [Alphaproteobacteria bacterium]|nr:dienelactone hydrolase family protein [Alphaproteobacteria bacterium]